MPNWMTTLNNNVALGFGARSLHEITIPGTHDAGCYIDRGQLRNFLSRTQSVGQNIGAQLAGGIRYFDIRPCTHGAQYWTYHGPYWGDRLDGPLGIINQVLGFMAGLGPGDRELVILNISHFYRSTMLNYAFTNADHAALTGFITATLGAHLVPHTQAAINLFNAPYLNILTDPVTGVAQSRVAIIYDGALDTAAEPWITAAAAPGAAAPLPAGFFAITPKYATPNGIRLFDQYANKRWVDDGYLYTGMRTDQLDKLRNRANYNYPAAFGGGPWAANAAGGVAGTLHLFSWTLTPQPLSDPLTVAMNDSNPVLVPLFNAANGWVGAGALYDPLVDPKINILYVDRYESHAHAHGGCAMNGWANPVALAMHLNSYTAAAPPVWPGWAAF